MGAGNSWAEGYSFGSGLIEGLKSGGVGALSSGVAGGLLGGMDALDKGTSFWTGKAPMVKAIVAPTEAVEGVSLTSDEFQLPYKITLKGIYNENPNFDKIHIERSRLPEDETWSGMVTFEKGEFGTRMKVQDLRLQSVSYKYVREVSYKINSVTYRADISYVENKGILHVVEVKSGANPCLTSNQASTIPALLKGGDVKNCSVWSKGASGFWQNIAVECR